MVKVDILLASYNGAKYIETQMLSIISQSFKDWKLIIHDDGSNDDTIAIVKKWQQLDSRIYLIIDKVTLQNAGKNFMHLLQYSTADYVMFCDQDDIWFDNKVELMYNEIIKHNCNKPTVLYSNAYVWMPKKGILGNATLTFPKRLNSLLFLNSGMQGCVSIFNKNMREMMLKWNAEVAMHDHILHLLALSVGVVEYMPLSLMLYRNHDANVTGSTRVCVFDWKSIKKSLNVPVVRREHYDAIKGFITIYADILNKKQLDLINDYLAMPNKSLFSKIVSVITNGFCVYDSKLILLTKLMFKPYITK